MRYLFQIMVMLGDLLLFACAAYVLYASGFDIICFILVFLAFSAWRKTGGFEAWTPSGIRAFMKNAKALGM